MLKNNREKYSHPLVNGVTAPIYNYGDAIKETIYVESTLDTDRDGKPDRIAADIIRPKESGARSESTCHYGCKSLL